MPREKKKRLLEDPGIEEHYAKQVIPEMMKEFGYKNKMQIPRLDKVVINVGMGEAISNSKLLDTAAAELAQITGQKPVVTKSKKSIAGFKLRQGMSIGCKVTLRGKKMYDFFKRFLHTALPNIRDFRGVSLNSFDGHGNYSLGIKEQLIFPEINYDDVAAVHGMDIILVTTARTDEEGRSLLRHLGIPFRNKNQ